MPIYDLDAFANPQVLAGTPPPLGLNPQPDQEYNQAYWFLTQRNFAVDDDSSRAVFDRSLPERYPWLQFAIKTLTVEADPTNPVSNCVTSNIETIVGQFLGAGPLLPGAIGGGGRVIPNIQKTYDHLPTGTVVEASLNLISTPFYGSTYWTLHNGISGRAFHRKSDTIYQWIVRSPAPPLDQAVHVSAPSGSLDLDAQPRANDLLTNDFSLFLFPGDCEKNLDQAQAASNSEVNAFTLFLAIKPGTVDKVARAGAAPVAGAPDLNAPPRWQVQVSFGDVTLTINEGFAEASVVVKPAKNPIPVPLDLNRLLNTTGRLNNLAEGEQYGITFIPVWNGILISDSPIRSTGFGTRAVFIPKNPNLTIYDKLLDFFNNATNTKPPRFGVGRANLNGQFPVPDAPRVDTGPFINVRFHNCGGSIRFAPVYFAPEIRTTFLMEPNSEDNPPWPDNVNIGPNISIANSNIPVIPNYTVVPFYHFEPTSNAVVEMNDVRAVQDDPATPWVVSLNFAVGAGIFASKFQFIRRPMEVWGFLLYGSQKALPAYKYGEGQLTDADLPQERIQSCHVTRSLDDGGGSGSIDWDYYDPNTGLATRPYQHIGAVQLAATGGVNTIPGVIFTGIGIGNQEMDSPGENKITLPLRGRDVKLRDDTTGIRLINSPFFDGYDHRDVLQWMCDYAGIPFHSNAGPFKLPTGSFMAGAPQFNFRANTAVWSAIEEVASRSATLVFFDRFGVLQQYDVGQTTGVNWTYGVDEMENYSDNPELLSMANAVLVVGLVSSGPIDARKKLLGLTPDDSEVQLKKVFSRPPTNPAFPWDKMSFYAMPGVLTPGDFLIAARRVTTVLTRPRAGTAQVTIPGNGQIDLLDTFNTDYVVTQVEHTISTGRDKSWKTRLGVELLVSRPFHAPRGKTLAPVNPAFPPITAANFPNPFRDDVPEAF